MATIQKIKVKDTLYDISPSPSGTLDTTTKDNAFASSDVSQGSATAWTDVAALAATETNKSMFTKATQMMKNTRYLYNIIGTGFSTSSTIKKAIDGKAASNHSHDLSAMINGLSVGTATPQDADYYVCQYAGGGNTTSTYHRRPMTALWDYIKTKGNSTWQPKGSYAAASHTHTKSQITDFPTSLPASDVYAWAKANTKPSYSWNEITGKPSSFTAASHTHTKSQITDFPSSLKNPTSLTIQGNGTALATYDGSAAKTVNITKSNIGLGNVNNTADSAKTVAKANQLTTTRTVSGGIDIPLSFTYNGSANSSASIGFYGCRVAQGNTNNYPFHRIGYTQVITGAYNDNSITLYITQGYQGGGFGIVRISVRTNNSNSASGAEARWLIRSGFNADQIQLGFYNVYGKTYCDIFLKTNSTYCGTVIRAIGSDSRGNISRTFTLCDSSESNDTTASDAKGSKESYVSIAAAGTAIHKQAYTGIITGSDNGTVSYANSAGSCTTANKIGTGTVGASNKPVYINGGTPTACNYSLGNACSKSIRTLTAQGSSGWKDATTDQGFVPDMAFMAYWNGAYSGSSSNLTYCCKGAFGTAATKNISDFAAASHAHDDRYYTESEMNSKLGSKVDNTEAGCNALMSKAPIWTAVATDDTYFIRQDTAGTATFGRVKFSTVWSYIKGKSDSTYQAKGSYASASHTHNYAGSGSAGGSANSAVKLDTATAGSTTQPVYFSGGKPVAIGYTIAKSVPADAKFTDTWRGIQNNLTSTATDQSLSAAQGKILKDALDKKTGVSVSGTTVVFG